MTKHRFDEIRVVVADAMAQSRKSFRGILDDLGFREIELFHNVPALQAYLELSSTDLVICDMELDQGEVADLIFKTRHGAVGDNPFLSILGTTWRPTPEVVQRTVNCGADGLLSMPISRQTVADAIETVVDRRKPFVVTTDYIGPDRRSGPREEGPEVPVIKVPNSLRQKATGEAEEVSTEKCIEIVKEQKVERHASQIGWLAKRIAEHYGGVAEDPKIDDHVEKLRFVADDLKDRISDTKYAHQGELCGSLLQVADNLANSESVGREKNIALLTQLSLAVQVALRTDDVSTVEAALDISRAVGARM
jgi:DNA-binding NarL/FixJ family response regulator